MPSDVRRDRRASALRSLLLLAALCALAGHAPTAGGVHAHSLHGSRTTQPPADFQMTLYAIGGLSGEFDVGPDGRGGLAALHTLVERKRRVARVGGRGGVLLVQSGDFTGATSDAAVRRKLDYPELNLARYLRLDAMGASSGETLAYTRLKQSDRSAFAGVPAVSFNLRGRGGASPQADAVAPLRLVRRAQYTALISSVTSGAEPRFETQPTALLAREFRRQSGADLYVLLLDRRKDPRPAPLVDSHNLHDAQTPKKLSPYLNSIDLLERADFWAAFFPTAPGEIADPYALPDQKLAHHWLIVESHAERNDFRRLPAGPYLCRLANDAVCEITVEFRRRRVRGVRARFIQLNGPQTPGGWVTPDPILLKTLKKQT